VFWAWVLGPLGAVLAIPMSLLVKGLLVDVDPSTRWLNALLAGGDMSDERESGPPVPTESIPAADLSKQAATEAATEVGSGQS
jgi:hypothetical protein